VGKDQQISKGILRGEVDAGVKNPFAVYVEEVSYNGK